MRNYLLFITVLFSLILVSCENSKDDTFCSESDLLIAGICHDQTAPIISGLEDINILIGTEFDPLLGITAEDAFDGDLTDKIEVTGNVVASELGMYYLKYTVRDESGNKIEAVRYISVVYMRDQNSPMLDNGDFSIGLYSWIVYNVNSGGFADFSVVDEELVVDIESINDGVWWEPRIHNEGIYFEQGVTYQISFDAKSSLPRSIHVHIGELFSGAPWFIGFMDQGVKVHDLSTEYQTFTTVFRMNDDSNDNGAILFEFGDVSGSIGTENLITTVFIDNVVITEVE